MKQESRNLAFAGVFSALGALILCLGGIFPLSTYVCPILASIAVLAVGEECGKGYARSCYTVIAALAVLLSPDKEAALLFAFLGYYPLVRERLDMLRPAALRVGMKLAVCAISVGTMYLLLIYAFRLEAVVTELRSTSPALLAATAALGLVTFLLYDTALARLTALYRIRKKRAKK